MVSDGILLELLEMEADVLILVLMDDGLGRKGKKL